MCGRIGMQNAPSAEPAAIEVSRFESKAMASSYSAMDVSDKVEDPEGPILTLWCSGDAPDSAQQHNFEGVWKLAEGEEPEQGAGDRPRKRVKNTKQTFFLRGKRGDRTCEGSGPQQEEASDFRG